MYPGEFEQLFRKISDLFPLKIIAKDMQVRGEFPKRSPETPIWESIESLEGCQYLNIGQGKYVESKNLLEKPLRILFFILLQESEGRLFRIHEWSGKNLSELNEKNLNSLITELVDSELINKQKEYPTRKEFKEDLKAISSFRNIIVHVNKKLERNVEPKTIVKRKKQVQRLLVALQQILDNIGHTIKYENLLEEQRNSLRNDLKNLEECVEMIYEINVRKPRPLVGEESILTRTLGDNFISPKNYEETYFETERKGQAKTEFSEFKESLKEYDKNPGEQEKLTLFMDVGDILFQAMIVKLKHQHNPLFNIVSQKFQVALGYVSTELRSRGLSVKTAKKIAETKYSIRAWLRQNGFIGKNKPLERQLCLDILKELESKTL
tara:strand:- start:5261 stop:6400 length:1140 start_codon:yes stop_codon:yes gene_type:complete